MMVLKIKVKANASQNEILGFREGRLEIRIKEAARNNQANKALLELLANASGIPKSDIRIKRGNSSPLKTIEVSPSATEKLQEFIHNQAGNA